MILRKVSHGILASFGLAMTIPGAALADNAKPGFLGSLRSEHLATSTVPANGDQNPYAMVISPVTSGSLQKGDLLAISTTRIICRAPAPRSSITALQPSRPPPSPLFSRSCRAVPAAWG
jgi:hypothetical protein